MTHFRVVGILRSIGNDRLANVLGIYTVGRLKLIVMSSLYQVDLDQEGMNVEEGRIMEPSLDENI